MSTVDEIISRFGKGDYSTLLILFPKSKWKRKGAYFWDWLVRDHKEWSDMKYTWIGSSSYGDQIISTKTSPLHYGKMSIYMHGPDVAGPKSTNAVWLDSILFLGNDYEKWLNRCDKYGDEYSIGPGGIDRDLKGRSKEYKMIYRKLNPGLRW